jgi:hypothetical protein
MSSRRTAPNKLHRIVAKTEALPAFAREQLLTLAFGRLIPYVRTSGVRVESLSAERCVVSIPNAKHVRNHIGGCTRWRWRSSRSPPPATSWA